MNKTKAILMHLQDKGNITTWEAIQEYGATRLSAIIYRLRHEYGLNIVSEDIAFTDRFGKSASYVKYILVKEQ